MDETTRIEAMRDLIGVIRPTAPIGSGNISSLLTATELLLDDYTQLRADIAKKDEEIARLRGWVRYLLSSNAAPPEGSNLREIIDEIYPIDVRDVYRATLSQDPEPVEGEGKQ